MKKTKEDNYLQILSQVRQIDCKIRCLNACFQVVSQPEMLDSVNYQLLGLKLRRQMLLSQLKPLYQKK